MVREIPENNPVKSSLVAVFSHPSSVDRTYNELLSLAETIAGSKASVLIVGETGTGKRTLARYIHEKSSRSPRPLQLMNCRETASGEQDAVFTDLVAKATGSTLVLAEIWKLAAPVQARLLDLIRNGADIRIVATSSRSLTNLMRNGDFKEELFYRLNGVNLKVPSLQERIGDIEVLARSMIARFATMQGQAGPELSEEAVLLLNSHRWGGNLRELESVCERAVLLSKGGEVRAKDIQFQAQLEAGMRSDGATGIWKPGRTLDEVERTVILEALKHFSGNRTHTAKALGISIRTLRNKLAEFRVMGIRA
jgi:two-component system response regulator FlrC